MRRAETRSLIKLFCLKSYTFNYLRFSGYAAAGLVFFIKSAEGAALEAGPTFALFSCFSFLSVLLGVYFSNAILCAIDLKTTLARTTSILLLQEKTKHQSPVNEGVAFALKQASISWNGVEES